VNIFIDRMYSNTFRRLKPMPGTILNRLNGVNITFGKEVKVEPVYLPLVRYEHQGKLTFIELAWNRPFVCIFLMPVRPFVNIQRTDKMQLEDE